MAMVMLNTDAHNRGVKRKMTKKEFVTNTMNAGVSSKLTKGYLEQMYDRYVA